MSKPIKCMLCCDTKWVHARNCPANQAWDIAGACQCQMRPCPDCKKRSLKLSEDRTRGAAVDEKAPDAIATKLVDAPWVKTVRDHDSL